VFVLVVSGKYPNHHLSAVDRDWLASSDQVSRMDYWLMLFF
jgi:hypothetical protein